MKNVFIIMLTVFAFSTTGFSNLIENGALTSGVKYWSINRHPDYGFKTKAKTSKSEGLVLSGLRETKGGYMSISQAVEIEAGKKYKISFEVKGASAKGFGVSLGDWAVELMTSKRQKFSDTSWHKVECVLEAKGTTDSKWFKAWRKASRKAKLDDGKTKMEKVKEPKDREESPANVLRFGIGMVDGEFGLRNVVMEEVK